MMGAPWPSGEVMIGGEFRSQTSLGTLGHVNPATGKVQGEFAIGGAHEVDLAVHAARDALDGWRRVKPLDRQRSLMRLAELFERDATALGLLGVAENGVPIAFASFFCGVVPAEWFRYYAGWIDKFAGDVLPTEVNALNYTRLEPHGVVGIFTAFNAPTAFLGMKVAPALAAGNTVVIKPSELAPWTTLRFAELCVEAGLPPGVVNVVPGDARAGEALASHPGLDKLTFTGSAVTARSVLAAAAQTLTPVTLELGGKSASVIFADADLDQSVATAVQGGLIIQSGQACAAGARLLIQREIYDEVAELVLLLADDEMVGDPMDAGTVMGPVISERHCERILGVIERAQAENAGDLLAGGSRMGGSLAGGYFVQPTVFGNVDWQSHLAQEEVFGPVLSLIPFDTEAEAVAISNGTNYGLAGYVFTRDLGRAHRVAAEIDAGYLSVNTFNPIPPTAPFGGVKNSGFGREGGYDGIKEMSRIKNVHVVLG